MEWDKEDSFISRYLRFMSTQETAHAYDMWCALWCISCACGRATYVARPRAPVYLNMYVVLVGDSGIPRKSTSVNMALRLVRELFADSEQPAIIDAMVTAERLDELLHEQTKKFGSSQIIVGVSELAAFVGAQAYMNTMPVTLTDLYDCPTHRVGGTVSRGVSEQKDVWISMLSGSTPVWLLRTVNPRIVEGGFSSRCMFVISNEPKQSIPWPSEEDNDYDRSQLMDALRDIRDGARARGPIRIVDTALAAFSEWYTTREHSTDPYKQSFEAREDAHVLRIAALLCINDGSWEIRTKHIRYAIELVASIKQASGTVFEQGIMRTKYAAAYDLIRTQLLSSGNDPIPRHVLQRKCRYWLQLDELNSLVLVMHEYGVLQRYMTAPENNRGRPTEYYCGTDKLLEKGMAEHILNRFA
jgi:uncharacterized protein DUF3987